MPGVTVDGNDPLAVYQAVKEAADRARAGDGSDINRNGFLSTYSAFK